jgi:hypothetical protein
VLGTPTLIQIQHLSEITRVLRRDEECQHPARLVDLAYEHLISFMLNVVQTLLTDVDVRDDAMILANA